MKIFMPMAFVLTAISTMPAIAGDDSWYVVQGNTCIPITQKFIGLSATATPTNIRDLPQYRTLKNGDYILTHALATASQRNASGNYDMLVIKGTTYYLVREMTRCDDYAKGFNKVTF